MTNNDDTTRLVPNDGATNEETRHYESPSASDDSTQLLTPQTPRASDTRDINDADDQTVMRDSDLPPYVVTEYDEPTTDDDDKEENYDYEDRSIRGWLSFFLWVGIGLGCVVSAYNFFRDFNSFAFNSTTSVLGVIYMISYVCMGFYTIFAFVRHQGDAVAAGIAFTSLTIADGIIELIACSSIDIAFSNQETVAMIRPIVWGSIWLLFLLCSTRVRAVIPPSTRYVGRVVPILGSVVLIFTIVFCYNLTTSINEYLNDNGIRTEYDYSYVDDTPALGYSERLDNMIAMMNFPEIIGDGIALTGIDRDGDDVIFNVKVHNADFTYLSESNKRRLEKDMRAGILESFKNAQKNALDECIIKGGFNLIYRYRGMTGSNYVEIKFTNAELREFI